MFSNLSYESMLNELFERHPSVQTKGFSPGAYKPGLDAMKKFDTELGSPWTKYKIVHIAGTNGKGSVSSMIASALNGLGLKVGLYTSPHLIDFRERIKIIQNDEYKLISKEYVYDFVTKHNLDSLSFFEITTALAFQYFAYKKVDYAVIETGLGGELDSTNIVIPELSVITSIGLDHCDLLGKTLSEVAKAKAGIIKQGAKVLIEEKREETSFVFETTAQKLDAYSLEYVGDNALVDKLLSVFCGSRDYSECFDLNGPYQKDNIRTAIQSILSLELEPNLNSIASAAKITGFRGRWEIIQKDTPLIICDIGHNPAALKYNFARLVEMNRPLFIVYGVMADKDYRAVRELMPQNAYYIGVSPNSSRALPLGQLASVLNGLSFELADSVKEGVYRAIKIAKTVDNSVVYIGGSNFVVAEAVIARECNDRTNPVFNGIATN